VEKVHCMSSQVEIGVAPTRQRRCTITAVGMGNDTLSRLFVTVYRGSNIKTIGSQYQ
jgi:hypothetical protein